MVRTPYGYRSQVRTRKDIHNLSQTGGHAKSQMRLARSILVPTSSQKAKENNASRGTKRRLCGNKEAQVGTGAVLASMLSRTKVETLFEYPKFSHIGTKMANETLKRIGGFLGPNEILEVCDSSAITQDAYSRIYKKFKCGVKASGCGVRIGCLPTPNAVSTLRTKLNSKLHEFVGEYYHIDDNLVIPPNSKSKKKKPQQIVLNEMNSIFVDVEAVQRTMVRLYEIAPEGN